MGYNIKTIKKEFKAKGIFYTTNELAMLIKSFVDVDTNEVYEKWRFIQYSSLGASRQRYEL